MRELNQKQLWLLKMLFEEGIEEDEIQRYAKDNAPSLRSRLKRKIGEPEIKAQPAVLQSAEEPRGDREDEPKRDRRTKGKSKAN